MNHADVKKPWEASSVANAFPIFQTKGYEGLLKDIYSEIIPNDAKSHFDLANPEHQALVKQPFSVQGFPKTLDKPPGSYVDDESKGWTYIEVAWRLRMLYACLYACAMGTAGKQASLEASVARAKTACQDPKAGESEKEALRIATKERDNYHANYVRSFFEMFKRKEKDDKAFERDTQKCKELFPQAIRDVLILNQDAINSALRDNLKANPNASPFVVSFLQKGPPVHELAVPLYQKKVRAKVEGSIGPISPEVAFILALQLAGIDLVAMRIDRYNKERTDFFEKDTPPPQIYTSASFAEGNETADGEPKRIKAKNAIICGNDMSNTLHSTVRTMEKPNFGSAGVGLSLGIDLEEGYGDSGAKDTKSKLKENNRYFSFSFHAADVTTAAHAIYHDKDPKLSFYVFTSETEASPNPDGIKYPAPQTAAMRNIGNLLQSTPPEFDDSPAIKAVRPHCHQGFWERRRAFDDMFLKNGNFNPKEANMPQYVQVRPIHMYVHKEEQSSRAIKW